MRALRLTLLLVFAVASAPVWSQALLQGGPWTPGHASMYVGQGSSQPVVQDSGPAGGGGPGVGLSELNITSRSPTSTYPSANSGTGPLNTHACLNDAPNNNSTGYHFLCFDANASGGGLIAYGAGGVASTLPLNFSVNGATYQFPFSINGIVGPGTTVANDAACWNNTVGTLLKDCGTLVTGPATTVANDAACWNNTVGTLLKDCGVFATVGGTNTWTGTNNFTGPFQVNSTAQTFPPSGAIVGASDIQSLTNKSISASEVNSGTLASAQMPALSGAITSSAGSTVTALASGSAGWGTTVSAGALSISTAQPPYGYNVPINMGLTASAAGSALTINLTGANGSAPSATNPVLVPFRSTTLATGTPNWTAITSALSITVPSSATLGTANGVPFRIWLFLAYNSGTPELGVAVCSSTTQVFPCASWETRNITSTTISSSATNSSLLYATTGVIGDSVRIIGYAEYSSGLAAAGAWVSTPTNLQLFGPGVKKPGDIIQTIEYTQTSVGSTTSTSFVALSTNPVSQAITPTSAANLIRISLNGTAALSSGTSAAQLTLVRSTTPIGNPVGVSYFSGVVWNVPVSILFYDAPGVSSSTTYNVYGKTPAGTLQLPTANTGVTLELQEIMG